MQLHFLGTNGWFDSKTGNTPCALLDTKEAYIIFDAGFGLVKIKNYIKEDKPIYLFISHLHLDHICGLHTLPALKLNKLNIITAKESIKFLHKFMDHPYMGSPKMLSYPIEFIKVGAGRYDKPINFNCLQLKHTDFTLGYRIEIEDKIISYCSDTAVCKNNQLLAQGADILIQECAFPPGYSDPWGHTNPEQAAGLAKNSRVKKLLLTHFGANDYDTMEKRKEAEKIAKKIFPETVATKDGMNVTID